MDRWKRKEIKQMELGGNKNAGIYYEKNGMMVDGKPNHKAPALSKYKSDLLFKAEQAIAATMEPTSSSTLLQESNDKTK